MKESTLQIDESVKLPAGVRAAAARAQQLYDATRGDAQGEAEEVTPQGNELDAQSLLTQAQPQEAPQQAQSEATQTDTSKGDNESWEHKYKSMHGRFTRSQEQIRELTERIANMQNVMATLQATTASAAPLPELSAERLISDEEAAEYGEDFLSVVGKKAREELAPVIKGYQDKIAELERRLEGFTGKIQQDSHKELLSKLDEKLPNWRELNTNQEFLDWLSLPDPYSGAIRHDMLKAAYAHGDAHRVLAFFNGFLSEEAVVAPAGQEPDAQVTKVPKVPLAHLAAPGRAKTAAASTAPAEKPIFTRAQIAAFYADVAAGKYRGRDTEKNKAEAMIFDAQREGRIR